MNLVDTMTQFEQVATKKNGTLDRDKFRVLILLLQAQLQHQGVDMKEHYAELNRHIRERLGSGHSLISCIQFFDGKAGKAALQEFCDVLSQFVAPIQLEELQK